MPEPILERRSALAGILVPGHHGPESISGATLQECQALTLLSLAARAGQTEALSAAIQREFGVPLPRHPARSASGTVAFVWSGPELWLAIGSDADDLARRLAACASSHGSITDLTGSRAVVRISGPSARQGMMKLVPIDLDETVFSAGSAALTVASHIPVQLWQTEDTPTYEIACPRSFSASLWHNLAAAFAEYGYSVVE